VESRARLRRQRAADRLRLRLNVLAPVIAHLERATAETRERGSAAFGWGAVPRRTRRLQAGLQRLKTRKQLLSAWLERIEPGGSTAAFDVSGGAGRARAAGAADYDE
jgi:hypothetical protein